MFVPPKMFSANGQMMFHSDYLALPYNNVAEKYGSREKCKLLFHLDIKQRQGRCYMAERN